MNIDLSPASIAKLSARERILLASQLAAHAASIAATAAAETADGDQWLTVAEAATMIRQSQDWIYKHQTDLPWCSKRGRSTRCSLNGIKRWMEGNP